MPDSLAPPTVPMIDIGPSFDGDAATKRRIAEAIHAACTDIGFFAITGHRVPDAKRDALLSASHAFFEQSMEEKLRAAPDDPETPRGYRVFQGEALGRVTEDDAPPDLKEFYHIGPDAWPEDDYHTGADGQRYFIPNRWPSHPAEFREASLAYYREMETLEHQLLRLSAIGLGMPEAFFDDKIDRHVTAMRINHYPPQTEPAASGQIRAGAHTDYGGMTILLGEDGPGGLQVKTRQGDWIDVETRPEFFVVNIGDLLMRWTNDVWVSNPHRVLNPPADVAATARRISIGYFHQPNYDAMIECMPSCCSPDNPAKYPPVRSGNYRDQKYSDTYAADDAA